MPSRRQAIAKVLHSCAAAATAATLPTIADGMQQSGGPQRYLLIGLCGSENPTRANFPFAWASALKEAGHEVRLELAGDATVLMRTVVANSVTPVGWPALSEASEGDRPQDPDLCLKSVCDCPWGGRAGL